MLFYKDTKESPFFPIIPSLQVPLLHSPRFVLLPPFLKVLSHLEPVLVEQVVENERIHSSLKSGDRQSFVRFDWSIDTEWSVVSGYGSGSRSKERRRSSCRGRKVDRSRLRSESSLSREGLGLSTSLVDYTEDVNRQ